MSIELPGFWTPPRDGYNSPVMSLLFLESVPAFKDLAEALKKGERELSLVQVEACRISSY